MGEIIDFQSLRRTRRTRRILTAEHRAILTSCAAQLPGRPEVWFYPDEDKARAPVEDVCVFLRPGTHVDQADPLLSIVCSEGHQLVLVDIDYRVVVQSSDLSLIVTAILQNYGGIAVRQA